MGRDTGPTARMSAEAIVGGAQSSEKGDAFIPVYEPSITEREKAYVIDCLDTSWISSLGKYIERFENGIAQRLDVPHAIAVSNGTVALHLAYHCLGLGPGDEVLVPSFTYIASVNAIAQTGATPVFVESRPDDWLIDLEDAARKVTSRTRAIVPVHLYGMVCDMPAVMDLARAHGLFVIEDTAEALGSTLRGKAAGTFGDVGTLSFFGNKTLTTGEGGMVVASDDALSEQLRRAKGQGQAVGRRYWHDIMGFNYRMTNICAAIGFAQLERLDETLRRKQEIAALYRRLLADTPVAFQATPDGVESSEWLVSLLLPDGADRERIGERMRARKTDTRPVFHCAHEMPVFRQVCDLPVGENIARRGMSLPSFPTMTNVMVERVADALQEALQEA